MSKHRPFPRTPTVVLALTLGVSGSAAGQTKQKPQPSAPAKPSAAEPAAPVAPDAPDAQAAALDAEIKALKDQVGGLEKEKESLKKSLEEQKSQLDAAKTAAKEQAASAVKDAVNQFKYVELAFGVLPNSDKKVNNYAQVKANYTPALTSSFTYYSRNLGSTEKKSTTRTLEADSLVKELRSSKEASVSTEQTKLELNVIQYKVSPWQIGGLSLVPSFIAGVDQIRDNRDRFITGHESYNDPLSGKERTIISNENITEEQVGTLPHLDLDLVGRSDRLFFGAGVGALVANSERVSWRSRGSFYTPGLTIDANQPDVEGPGQLYENDDERENKFSSNGIKAHVDFGWQGPSNGFGGHFQYLTRKGKRDSYNAVTVPLDVAIDPATGKDTNAGKQRRIVETSKVEETTTSTLLGVSWTMNFAKTIGIVPELRINMQTDKVSAKGDGKTDTDESKQYDFGLVFSY